MSYSRAFVDAAVEYKCVPLLHGFKNEIVLNSAGRANTYSFVTDFDGLTPRDSTGYSIPLEDENGEVVTYLALEELMDAAGNYSMENVIDIAQYENGQYLVTITLDEAFLADEDTVYPVTASASSTGWLYHTSMDDTHIMQGYPNTNYYSSTLMPVGYSSGVSRVFMQFVFTAELKSLINPDRIIEAELYLWDQSTDTTRRGIQLRIPANVWTASTITWNNNPGYYTGAWNGLSVPTNHTISGEPGWWAYPYMGDIVAAMLRNYIDNSLSNTIHEKRGIMIKMENEGCLKTFRSSNHSSNRPNLSITYNTTSAYNYGAASPYRTVTGTIPNCIGYALEKSFSISPQFNVDSQEVITPAYAEWLITNHIRTNNYADISYQLNSTASLPSNSYRIAFRINRTPELIGGGNGWVIQNYHMIVQTSDKGWAHKVRTDPSEILGMGDPDTTSSYWTCVSGSTTTATINYRVNR